jgi:hypothetical protein
MIAWLKHHHKKIREIGAGLFIFETFNYVWDFAFYPFAIAYWGISLGGVIAVGATTIVNAFVFWLYEYMRVDWLGAHALRELDDKENKTHIEKLATWIGRKKITLWEKLLSPIVFVVLLLPIDPVIVAIHYRKNHFGGLTWRDWNILFWANLIANAWWLLKISLVIEAIKWLWVYFF